MSVAELSKEIFSYYEKIWCECEVESEPIFHDDDFNGVDVVVKCIGREKCVEKHHYHCGWCLGVCQIG